MSKNILGNKQKICMNCGFCCDNTLFEHVGIKKAENVADIFKKSLYMFEGNQYFRLPCPHFNGKCAIYNLKKPYICSYFKCKLLRRFIECEIDFNKAMNIIDNAKKLRAEIIELYKKLNNGKIATFGELVTYIREAKKNDSKEFKILKAKISLLNLLLIKYFESKKTFDGFLKPNQYD